MRYLDCQSGLRTVVLVRYVDLVPQRVSRLRSRRLVAVRGNGGRDERSDQSDVRRRRRFLNRAVDDRRGDVFACRDVVEPVEQAGRHADRDHVVGVVIREVVRDDGQENHDDVAALKGDAWRGLRPEIRAERHANAGRVRRGVRDDRRARRQAVIGGATEQALAARDAGLARGVRQRQVEGYGVRRPGHVESEPSHYLEVDVGVRRRHAVVERAGGGVGIHRADDLRARSQRDHAARKVAPAKYYSDLKQRCCRVIMLCLFCAAASMNTVFLLTYQVTLFPD